MRNHFAARFVVSYLHFKPDYEAQIIIGCNGGPLPLDTELVFSKLPNPSFYPRSNQGWDIGFYIEAAKGIAAGFDLVVCLGESVYFHRAGWLKRLAEAYQKHGPGMYGFLSSNVLRPHLQTTAFACSPELLRDYPLGVSTKADRYLFEHGDIPFWRRVRLKGLPVLFVTWDGEYPPETWRSAPNILWTGDQTNLLLWCNHVDRYRDQPPARQASWRESANRAFK